MNKFHLVFWVLGFTTIWAIMLLVWGIHITSDTGNRYQIVNSDNCVILLDKRSGLTWRNVWNNEDEQIPNHWVPMIYEGNNVNIPIGEQRLRQHYKKDYWIYFPF